MINLVENITLSEYFHCFCSFFPAFIHPFCLSLPPSFSYPDFILLLQFHSHCLRSSSTLFPALFFTALSLLPFSLPLPLSLRLNSFALLFFSFFSAPLLQLTNSFIIPHKSHYSIGITINNMYFSGSRWKLSQFAALAHLNTEKIKSNFIV